MLEAILIVVGCLVIVGCGCVAFTIYIGNAYAELMDNHKD